MTPERAREVLGVEPGASEARLTAAYRLGVKRTHPDKGGSERAFREVVEAHALLKKLAFADEATPDASHLHRPIRAPFTRKDRRAAWDEREQAWMIAIPLEFVRAEPVEAGCILPDGCVLVFTIPRGTLPWRTVVRGQPIVVVHGRWGFRVPGTFTMGGGVREEEDVA